MTLFGWFDGACGPQNPGGTAAYGALIRLSENGPIAWSDWRVIGSGPAFSNNVAEYAGFTALVTAFLRLEIREPDEVVILGDADMVVRQMRGEWRAKGGLYYPWWERALGLLGDLEERCAVGIAWVPREQNVDADELSKRIERSRS